MHPLIKSFLAGPYMLSSTYEALLQKMDQPRKLFDAPCPLTAATKAATAARQQPKSAKYTAVLPMFGMIDQHGGWIVDMMGGTSLASLNEAFDLCMSEDRISNVMLHVHSPGGSVYGVKEMADKIHAARGTKPVCAVANSMMASAAYYIGSACDRVYATVGADVGSVGVYQMHFNYSAALKDDGIECTIIREPAFKAEGNPYEPLTDEATQEMKSDVHRIYQQFTSDVARYRGMDVGVVRDTFGKGRTMDAASAQKCGMINRVATYGDVLARMQAGTIRPSSGNAADDGWDSPMLEDFSDQRRRKLNLIGVRFDER